MATALTNTPLPVLAPTRPEIADRAPAEAAVPVTAPPPSATKARRRPRTPLDLGGFWSALLGGITGGITAAAQRPRRR